MKKWISIMLILVFAFSVVAWGDTETEASTNSSKDNDESFEEEFVEANDEVFD